MPAAGLLSWLASLTTRPFRLLAVLALMGGLGWGTYHLVGRRPLPPPPPDPKPATHVMKGLSLTEVQDGVKRWVLEANTADYRQEEHLIHLTGIYLEFYGDNDRVVSLSCQNGLVDTKTRSLMLKDHVEVSEGDHKITTDLVRYQSQQRLLEAPHEVVLETPRLRVEGRNLTIYLSSRRLVLNQHRLTEVILEDELKL